VGGVTGDGVTRHGSALDHVEVDGEAPACGRAPGQLVVEDEVADSRSGFRGAGDDLGTAVEGMGYGGVVGDDGGLVGFVLVNDESPPIE